MEIRLDGSGWDSRVRRYPCTIGELGTLLGTDFAIEQNLISDFGHRDGSADRGGKIRRLTTVDPFGGMRIPSSGYCLSGEILAQFNRNERKFRRCDSFMRCMIKPCCRKSQVRETIKTR